MQPFPVLFMAAFVIATLLVAAAAINAVYFHYRFQRELDREIMKSSYYDGGLLMNLNRLMMYGHYCFFPKRAKRDGVYEIFQELDRRQRLHLQFHWIAIILSVLLYFSGYFYAKANGMLE